MHRTFGLVFALVLTIAARSEHASVMLSDGRVLVLGGRTAEGPTATAEIYIPASDTWTAAGSMVEARTGFTATLLNDGRVLVAGGEVDGVVSATFEIYDPETDAFALAGSMSTPRRRHAASRLLDGRVLITGGSDGSTTLATADIYDVHATSIAPAGTLATARESHSSTTLLDGRVLIAAGTSGTDERSSAEVYDPVAGTFAATGALGAVRADHLAFRLPENNAVLIVGGSAAGAAVGSAELYHPWSGAFRPTGAPAAARIGGTGTRLRAPGRLLVAGGASAVAELYGFATLRTDRNDYAPGEPVTITGSGWQPGETVTMLLQEGNPQHPDRTLTAVADAAGNIVHSEFAPEEHHRGVRFYLTARGAVSEAQTTFTDSHPVVVSVTGDWTVLENQGWASFTFSVSDSSCNPGWVGVWSETADGTATAAFVDESGRVQGDYWSLPRALRGSFLVQIVNDNSHEANEFFVVGLTLLSPFCIQTLDEFSFATHDIQFSGGGGRGTVGVAIIDDDVPAELAVPAVTGTYGGTVSLSATLTSQGVPLPGRNVSFRFRGEPVGSATTSASGVATLPGIALKSLGSQINLPLGTYPNAVEAFFAGDETHVPSRRFATLVINKAPTTTTFTTSPNPSAFGQRPAFTVTVTSAAGPPPGSITIKEGETILRGPFTLDANGQVRGTLPETLSPQFFGHRLTAEYSGSANFEASSAAITQFVFAANTTTSVSAIPNPSVFGRTVTLQASVQPQPAGFIVPTARSRSGS